MSAPSAQEFRWPPGPSRTTKPVSARPTTSRVPETDAGSSRSRVRETWRAIEDAWLAPRARSFANRAAASDWTPDPPRVYCPRCAESVGPYEADATGCSNCREQRLPWSLCVRLGEYDSLLRGAIHDLKFSAWRRVGRELGHLLGEAVVERLAQSELRDAELVFIPIPTSYRRRIGRGIDHSLVLASAAARTAQAPLVRALSREHRPEQWAVPPSQRARNVSGAFRVRRFPLNDGQVIVLVDDIRTSGATMRSASRTLRAGYRRAGCRPPRALVSAVVAVSSGGRRAVDAGTVVDAAQGSPGGGEFGGVEPRNMERLR